MAQKIQPVRPEDFDAVVLKQAAEEGRLFILPLSRSIEDELEDNAQHILSYVRRIHMFATEPYRSNIGSIWDEIVHLPKFSQRLMIQKGKSAGSMNKYLITLLVEHLRAFGVYDCESTLQLHRKLENIKTRNKYYNSMFTYQIYPEENAEIREIVNKLKNSMEV